MDPGYRHSAGPLQVRASNLYCHFREDRIKIIITRLSFVLFSNLYSKLQGNGLNEKFLHYCEKWIQVLEKIQESLAVDVAHSPPALLEQQKTYEVTLCSATPQPLPPRQGTGKGDIQVRHKECPPTLIVIGDHRHLGIATIAKFVVFSSIMFLDDMTMMVERVLQLASGNLRTNHFTGPLRALLGSMSSQFLTMKSIS